MHLRLYPVQLILVMCIVKLTRMTVSNNKLSHVNDCQIFQPCQIGVNVVSTIQQTGLGPVNTVLNELM